jgi:hypothetical protein
MRAAAGDSVHPNFQRAESLPKRLDLLLTQSFGATS